MLSSGLGIKQLKLAHFHFKKIHIKHIFYVFNANQGASYPAFMIRILTFETDPTEAFTFPSSCRPVALQSPR